MASSPDPAPARTTEQPGWPEGAEDEAVRWPLLAKVGLAIAVVTVAICLAAAVYAAFVFEGG